MSVSDPVADMLARIRNALLVRKRHVVVPTSKLKVEIARVLKAEGYIEHYDVTKDRPQAMIRIRLKYTKDNQAAVEGMRRISKPGRRVYASRDEIPLVLNGIGIAILSTPRGVMTGKKAHGLGVGGEVLCHVW